MRLKSQIPVEATRGFSVSSEEHLTQDSAKGGKRGKRIELTNQALITTAGDPEVSPDIDGQEEEQTAGYRDAPRSGTIASTPCGSLTMRKRSTPNLSTPCHAIIDQMSNTRCSWPGMPRQQHLRQTAHALSPYAGLSDFCGVSTST